MRRFPHRRTTTPAAAPVIAYRTVDEQKAAYYARFGTTAGMDWAYLYRMERNRGGQ